MGKDSNKEKKKDPSRTTRNTKQAKEESVIDRVEFHRHAVALMPDPADRRPGIAYFVKGSRYERKQRFCTCSVSKTRTCPHLLELTKAYKILHKDLKDKSVGDDFRSSIWRRIGAIIAGNAGDGREKARLHARLLGDGSASISAP